MTLDLKLLKEISGSTVQTQETQGCSNLSSTKTNRIATNPEAVEHRKAQDRQTQIAGSTGAGQERLTASHQENNRGFWEEEAVGLGAKSPTELHSKELSLRQSLRTP